MRPISSFRYDLYPAPHGLRESGDRVDHRLLRPEDFYADHGRILQVVHPDYRALMESVLRGECANGSTAGIRCLHRDGKVVWIDQRAMHVKDQDGRLVAVEAIARDVTDRKRLEKRLDEGTMELRRSLVEKTALLKEVHHRVKNNPRVIYGLLSMQIECAGSENFSAPCTTRIHECSLCR